MNIGEKIKLLRTMNDLTQAGLAKEISISPGNIGDWERGKTKPGSDALATLIQYFNVSADWLLIGKGEPKPLVTDSSKDNVFLLTDDEKDIILKFRQFDLRDQEDIKDIVGIKYKRMIERKK